MQDLTPVDEALGATSFGCWYPKFRRVAPKATVLDVLALEPGFLEWLEADSILLPRDSGRLPSPSPSSSSSEEEEGPDFPNLTLAIRTALQKYEGAIFPKLNWSAPQDAAWILPGPPLRCTEPADLYLLLKSSDFITKDIAQRAEMHCPPRLELVCKMWFDMPRSHEFRVFVRDGAMRAVAQRDVTFYEHLQGGEVERRVVQLLAEFFENELSGKVGIKDFVWDAYLTRGMGRVFLVDINPFLLRTDPILYTWQELDQLPPSDTPPLRLITSHAQASQSFPTYSSNMVPKDVIDVSSGQNIAEFAREWNANVKDAI